MLFETVFIQNKAAALESPITVFTNIPSSIINGILRYKKAEHKVTG